MDAAGVRQADGWNPVSPDSKRAVFIRDYNLWVRDVATGKETQLTKDGIKDFGYATDNAGWTRSDRPIVLWSPDSKKIATFQQDQRGVGEMYLVDTKVGHPDAARRGSIRCRAMKWSRRSSASSSMWTSRTCVRLQMPPDQHRSSLCDDVACRGGEWGDVQWSPDGTHLAFVSTSRDHKQEVLRIADAATGAVRDVMEEKVADVLRIAATDASTGATCRSPTSHLVFRARQLGPLYLYDSRPAS